MELENYFSTPQVNFQEESLFYLAFEKLFVAASATIYQSRTSGQD